MCAEENMIDLGFAGAHLPAGSHICQIYSEDEERDESVLKFLLHGLKGGERGVCFSDNVSSDLISRYFAENDLSLTELEESGAFALGPARDTYFKGNEFNPERMLGLLTEYYDSSMEQGYTAARVIGEMSSDVSHVHGGKRLLEYESRVSMLLRERPVTAVCQYNAHQFDGATIMDVLKVHPMMVIRGSVVMNPFFIPPEEFLKTVS